MPVPTNPKIYHIMHVDRLPSIVEEGYLWCDEEVNRRALQGTPIGMTSIKQRRRNNLLTSCPGLRVSQCAPFYFCPRSVMLFMIDRANNPELPYLQGQNQIIHLVADLHETINWAQKNNRRWAVTLSNAGSSYFEDRCTLDGLNEIDWDAVKAQYWQDCREKKQAEFLIETNFPWTLVERIGVISPMIRNQAITILPTGGHRPPIDVLPEWYY